MEYFTNSADLDSNVISNPRASFSVHDVSPMACSSVERQAEGRGGAASLRYEGPEAMMTGDMRRGKSPLSLDRRVFDQREMGCPMSRSSKAIDGYASFNSKAKKGTDILGYKWLWRTLANEFCLNKGVVKACGKNALARWCCISGQPLQKYLSSLGTALVWVY